MNRPYLFLLFLIPTIVNGQDCSGVFEEIGGRCLFVDPFVSASWDESRFLCLEFGGELVSIDNDDLYLDIIGYINSNAIEHRSYWIGGSDREVEGSWQWMNGNDMELGTPYWAVYAVSSDNYTQEPSNHGEPDVDCIQMDATRFLYYDDDDCREQKSSICERIVTECPTNPSEICTECNGIFSMPLFSESSTTADELTCHVTISWDYNFVPDNAATSPGMVFTCSYDDGSLCSGSEVDVCASCGTVTFSNINPSRNPILVYSDTCGNVDAFTIGENCQFVIETTTPFGSGDCSGVYDEIGGRCLFVDPFVSASWDEASFLCTEFGGELVSIDSDELYLEIIDYIQRNAIEHRSYWIGGSDRVVEGSWRWLNGELMEMGTPYWAVYAVTSDLYLQEPVDQGVADVDCIQMDSTRFLYYDDEDCRIQKSSICERVSNV